MRKWLAGVLLVLLATTMSAQQRPTSSTTSASPIKITFESYTLPNGLTVILSVDHTSPTVAVDV